VNEDTATACHAIQQQLAETNYADILDLKKLHSWWAEAGGIWQAMHNAAL
jgi:hypothetical protein